MAYEPLRFQDPGEKDFWSAVLAACLTGKFSFSEALKAADDAVFEQRKRDSHEPDGE